MDLNEVRTELNDSIVNFMGLTPPKKLSYLNFDDSLMNMPDKSFDHFTVMMNLSNKVIV